uniref:Uncharacterized protein n=1 Tax=Paramoeba aestuarina TaxID=180227 RepID=A0A7S4NX97_9EUKA
MVMLCPHRTDQSRVATTVNKTFRCVDEQFVWHIEPVLAAECAGGSQSPEERICRNCRPHIASPVPERTIVGTKYDRGYYTSHQASACNESTDAFFEFFLRHIGSHAVARSHGIHGVEHEQVCRSD